MPTDEQKPTTYTDAEYYGFFMTGLFGLLDDAEMNGYSPEGVRLLAEARAEFWREFNQRHPDAWKRD